MMSDLKNVLRHGYNSGLLFYFYIKVTASLQTQPFHALKSIFPLSSNFMGLGSTNFGQNINQVEKRKNVAFEDLP